MRNKQYTLEEELPPDVRIEVYKKALKFYKKGERRYGLHNPGLCLLLPCILWGLGRYLHDDPNGNCWGWRDTSIAFPEIHPIIPIIRKAKGIEAKMNIRIKFLEEIIQKWEN